MAETKTDGDVATPLALGGPVMGARIYVDTNGDGLLDIGSDPLLGLTDQSGSIQIDQQYAGQRLIADVGDAVDLLAGERLETGTVYTFIAPPDGNLIVSPLSAVLSKAVELEAELPRPRPARDVQSELLQKVFGDTKITPEDIANPAFYDPPQDENDPLAAQKLAIIEASFRIQNLMDTLKGTDQLALTTRHIMEGTKLPDAATEIAELANRLATGAPFAVPHLEDLLIEPGRDALLDPSIWGYIDAYGEGVR